jgi:hypothetical protein
MRDLMLVKDDSRFALPETARGDVSNKPIIMAASTALVENQRPTVGANLLCRHASSEADRGVHGPRWHPLARCCDRPSTHHERNIGCCARSRFHSFGALSVLLSPFRGNDAVERLVDDLCRPQARNPPFLSTMIESFVSQVEIAFNLDHAFHIGSCRWPRD